MILFNGGCSKKSDTQEAQGNVMVQVGVQTSPSSYTLQIVQLQGIDKLNEVAGNYAQFFYSPGATTDQLTGSAPHAAFVRAGSYFAPSDFISLQMATLYFHLQNLALLDKEMGAENVNHWPRSVGLETQIIDSQNGTQKNNAFYNGQTDSMMFVPFDMNNLPISINAGIIAHEHFHSLFFKLVILPATKSEKALSIAASIHAEEKKATFVRKLSVARTANLTEKEKNQYFNETFLRGINEGLADFWGWVYTEDVEFMRWSLPDYQLRRTLILEKDQQGVFATKQTIFDKVNESAQFYSDIKAALTNYAYEIGTPYARFMVQFTELQAKAKNISQSQSKKITAHLILDFIKEMAVEVNGLGENDTVDPLSLFKYVAKLAEKEDQVKLDQGSCDLLLKYINYKQEDQQKLMTCKQKDSSQKDQKDSSFVIVKP